MQTKVLRILALEARPVLLGDLVPEKPALLNERDIWYIWPSPSMLWR